MPKPPAHLLMWSPENTSYELWTQGHREFSLQAHDETRWLAWLETHPVFSFRGQQGLLHARKENRSRGQGYWYGYRSVARRTLKHYLGPAARVTLTRLEEIAGEFEQARLLTDRSRPAADAVPPAHNALSLPRSLKFRPPRLRERLVARPRLLQSLEDGQDCGLTLLAAPAGCGKTTLVNQWLASLQKKTLPVAWVSLDERDNDVIRFWRGVVQACQEISGDRTRTTLEHLSALERSPTLLEMSVLELVLTTFLDELASLAGHTIIVLEDYHFITLPQIHASLSFWLEHLPASLRVILLTRHDPPLPLAQWRARGMLHEIRSNSLRFTADETDLFFQYHSTTAVSRADILRLLERTEGWIAGLQLAMLVLNTRGREDTVGSALQSSHHYIADYLVREVLNHLPEHVQLFLQQTSVLERLQGRLCEAVTGQPEGQHTLTWLEQANLFLVPLDEKRQWYRYHHLFREVLLQRVSHGPSEDIAEIHRRACRWFLRAGMPAEAVTHACEAGDFATLADIIEQHQFAMLSQGENATLASWIHALPQTILFERLPIFFLACMENLASRRTQVAAELLNTYAFLHHLPTVGARDVDELERALSEHVGQLFPLQDDQQKRARAIYGFLGFYATLALVTESNVALYQQIRQRSERYAPPDSLRRQENWLASLLQGDVQNAIADLMNNLAESTTRQGNTILFTYLYPTLTLLLAATGQLQVIESIARRMLQREDTLDARLNHGPAFIDLGSVFYERNQLEQAEASIQSGLPLCHYPGSQTSRYRGLLLLTKIRRAREDRSAAWTILQELEMELTKSNLEMDTLKNWRGLVAWEALNLGNSTDARLWLHDGPSVHNLTRSLNPLSAQIYLTQAFFLLRFERRAEAETLLSELNRWARRLQLHGLLVSLLALQSILAQANGESSQAATMLTEALVLAEASGYVRVFLDPGEEMQALLRHLWNQFRTTSQRPSARYLARLLTPTKGQQTRDSARAPIEPVFSQPLIEPLSRREQEVLCEISEGYSNQEIARHLVISLSTVKSHINNIYRKLQTRNRAQTIAQARTFHLLPR